MHIGFRTSGGRGEYEVVGNHTGYSAISLEGWSFFMRWPDGIVRDTGLILEPADSGKPRLRSQLAPPFQIGRALAAMLLLPPPRRELPETGDSPFVVRSMGYVLSRLGFGPDTEFAPFTDMVTIDPTYVLLANTVEQETIGIGNRYRRIQTVYSRSDDLPANIKAEVNAHRAFMASGDTVTGALVTIVARLSQALTQNSGTGLMVNSDPLQGLERLLNIHPIDRFPTLPPPDQIGEEEPEISARSAHQYRLAKTRGSSARAFSLNVRRAYDYRCAFCGGRFGGVQGIRSGVDAAHILAWSSYELDVVSNGLTLCKLHHWAFDAAVLLPVYQGDSLTLRFTSFAEDFDSVSRTRLGTDRFVIPSEWLPADAAKRPSKTYLDRLHADLGATFMS